MSGEEGSTPTPATCVSTQDVPGGSGSSPGAPAAPASPGATAAAVAAVTTPAAPGQATPPSETPTISPGQGTLTNWTVAKGSANALNAFVEMNSPKPSGQDRPRKVRKVSDAASTASAGEKGKLRATRNHGNNKPKTVSARTRVLQFPGQGFSESFGKLYCRPCAKEISMDKETAVSHCGLAKSRKAGTKNRHEIKLAAWNERNGEAPGRLSRLETWGKEKYGRSTPKATQLQRTAVLESWLTAGLAVSRLDDVRQLFVDLGVDMVDSSKFKEYIGFLQCEEKRNLKLAFEDEDYSVAFDGSPVYHQEAFGVMVRTMGEDLVPRQNLVRLHLLAASMNARDIAAEVMGALQRMDLEPEKCVAFMYDSCSSNLKAVRTVVLKMFYQQAEGVQCCSHLLNNTGNEMDCEMAERFLSGVKTLLCQSYKNRELYRNVVGKTYKSVNAVRWGAAHECNQDIMENLVQVEEVLKGIKGPNGKPHKAAQRLVELLNHPIDGLLVKLQLALLCDVGVVITRATYALESDTPMIEKAWDIFQSVVTSLGVDAHQLTNPILPNTDAVIRDAAKGLMGVEFALKTEEVRALVLTSMEDLREYAFARFGGHDKAKFRKTLLMYKAARVICPRAISLYTDAHAVELQGLLRFKFVTPKLLLELKAELVVYFPIVKDLPDLSISTRDFWLAHKQQLPTWFGLVRKLWLIQPSSAMMERAFSVMNNIFGAQQTTVLNDLFELSVMLRHNRGVRRGARKDAADGGASSGGASSGGASASSALEIDSRSESSCSENSESDDDKSESDNGYDG